VVLNRDVKIVSVKSVPLHLNNTKNFQISIGIGDTLYYVYWQADMCTNIITVQL